MRSIPVSLYANVSHSLFLQYCEIVCWDLLAMLLQSDDPGYVWALTVLGFWLKLAVGVVGTILSICWLLQVILYNFVSPPTSPFLAQVFITLDGIFPLFGTLAFAIFCFYLIGEFHLPGLLSLKWGTLSYSFHDSSIMTASKMWLERLPVVIRASAEA